MSQQSQQVYVPPHVSTIHKETNKRIYERNIPSQPLQPYMNVRPLNTKYTRLPIVEPRQLEHGVPLKCYPVYNSQRVFYPASLDAPFSGYAAAINVESELKNQIYALQKCSQAVYVPSSTSDMYQSSHVMRSNNNDPNHAHHLLFKKEQFAEFNPNPYAGVVGVAMWGNNTRVQMQDVPEDFCSGNGSFHALKNMNILQSQQPGAANNK